jgi:putative membrane protein
MLHFTEEDRARVGAAVAQAEALSDGEIVTVVADSSDAYHDVALHWAVIAMLFVPALFAALPQSWFDWAGALLLGWNGELTRPLLMLLVTVKLAAVFLIVRFVLAWMPLRMALTPRATKGRRVARRALMLFRVAAEKRTAGRTGVLLYLSLRERRAEIVADEAIHKKVDADVWGEAMTLLVDHVREGKAGEGMALAVEKIGAVLAEHLPKTPADPNQIPDRLLEI